MINFKVVNEEKGVSREGRGGAVHQIYVASRIIYFFLKPARQTSEHKNGGASQFDAPPHPFLIPHYSLFGIKSY
jgi:hypothetical protein